MSIYVSPERSDSASGGDSNLNGGGAAQVVDEQRYALAFRNGEVFVSCERKHKNGNVCMFFFKYVVMYIGVLF